MAWKHLGRDTETATPRHHGPRPGRDKMCAMSADSAARAIALQAELHHRLLLDLQLMVTTRLRAADGGDWMFRLFRRQHEEKFLSGFGKLGWTAGPHAVACAGTPRVIAVHPSHRRRRGGIHMEESGASAWCLPAYPCRAGCYDGASDLRRCRWKPAAASCAASVSRTTACRCAYPRLGCLCVSEDMSEAVPGQSRLRFKRIRRASR